jgi:hypothetical protein
MAVIEERSANASCELKTRETQASSMSATGEIAELGILLLFILVGLLTLGFFLALGGLFAIVGPWLIFAVTHLVQQKRVKRAGKHLRQQALQLMVVIMYNHQTSKQSQRHQEQLPGKLGTRLKTRKQNTNYAFGR